MSRWIPKSFLFFVFLAISAISTTVQADIITYQFVGTADINYFPAGGGTIWSPGTEFQINFSIDTGQPDLADAPWQTQIGHFTGGTASVTVPDFGMYDLPSTNVTGLRLNSSIQRLNLVDPSNFFNPALAVTFSTTAIADANVIAPLDLSGNPTLTWPGTGLTWEFGAGNASFVFSQIQSGTVSMFTAIPEPSSLLCVLAVSCVAAFRVRCRAGFGSRS